MGISSTSSAQASAAPASGTNTNQKYGGFGNQDIAKMGYNNDQ